MCADACRSMLEGSNQVVSDQGVRKNLYQKVRASHLDGLHGTEYPL